MVHFSTHVIDHCDGDAPDSSINSRSRRSRDADIEAQTESPVTSSNTVASHVQLVAPTSEALKSNDAEQEPPTQSVPRSETGKSRISFRSVRKRARAETSTAYGASEMGRATGWQPGQEPGIDTSVPPAYTTEDERHRESVLLSKLHQQCEITVVDYSTETMNMTTLDNANLKEYLEKPVEDWSQVRWINVNGLSWDVIQIIGNVKNLHPLATEDLMNTRNRTKADFYNDQTFIILPLQRLINVKDQEDESEEEGSDGESAEHDYDEFMPKHAIQKLNSGSEVSHEMRRRRRALQHMKKHHGVIEALLHDIFIPKKKLKRRGSAHGHLQQANSFKNSSKVTAPWAPKRVRSLQEYHSGPNQDRIEFMERHSTLGRRGLGVSVEQVSIFLTSDNTVISFFEYSAQEVEIPILRRLDSRSTILRQSGDASMLLQSILDTIVDLAIPVTTAYQDAIGDLELAVLTDPAIQESTSMYILTSEIAVLRNAIVPVNQLIGTLKEHKPDAPAFTIPSRTMTPLPEISASHTLDRPALQQVQPRQPTQQNLNSGVVISPMTITYLGDVEDHVMIIQDSYDQMRRNADNLVDLIFNTVSAYQNESMKQLTIVTCFFLPLSFMTGYFGMNFNTFSAVKDNSDAYFWKIAGPVCGVVILLLLREWIYQWLRKWANKILIRRGRRRRLAGAKR